MKRPHFSISITVVLIFLINLQIRANVHIGPLQSYSNISAAATSGAIHPGDTVFLHAGSYMGYQSVTKLKGSADKWIVICPYADDQLEISGTWQFVSCEYIKFSRLTFKANAIHPGRLLSIDNGGSCTTQSLYITVDSCSFSKVSDANAIVAFKLAGVDHFQVSHSHFFDLPVCNAMDYNSCHDGLILSNRIENCLSAGHIKGGASDITMTRNLFINASKDPWVVFELGGDTGQQFYCPGDTFEVKRLRFYANILVNGYRGIALSSARECQVFNNTFYNFDQAVLRFLETSRLYPKLSGNVVANNLFAFGSFAYINGGNQAADAAALSSNLYYSPKTLVFSGPYWDTPALDAIREKNALVFGSSTPMFVDAANMDFHLVPSSPAIDKGSGFAAPLLDYYGVEFSPLSRSIGAVQFQTSQAISQEDEAESTVSLSPIPASELITIHGYKNEQVELYDNLGRRIPISVQGFEVDIRSLPTGFYLLKFGAHCRAFVKI